jgi:hypothetical protein
LPDEGFKAGDVSKSRDSPHPTLSTISLFGFLSKIALSSVKVRSSRRISKFSIIDLVIIK